MTDGNRILHTGLHQIAEPTHETVMSVGERHLLVNDDALVPVTALGTRPSIIFADPPAIEFGSTYQGARVFFERWATALNSMVSDNAALIVCYRERKGSGLLKSAIGTDALMYHGWQMTREFVWRYGEADFHRARPCFSLVHVLRRGSIAMQADAELRYKDIITVKPPTGSDQDKFIMEMPIEIPRLFINLFRTHDNSQIVFDPFCGTAVVAKAAQQLGLRSISYELERIQFEKMKTRVWPHLHEIPRLETGNVN